MFMLKRIASTLLAAISVILLVFSPVNSAYSALRWNPNLRAFEGNICANQYVWTYVPWQPIGTFCTIRLPNGFLQQGIIINQ